MIQDDFIRLEPFEVKDDIETVLDLIMKSRFTRLTRSEAKNALLAYPTLFWKGYDKLTSEFLGVIYLTKYPEHWTLDAYRQELTKAIDNNFSYRAGKLISDYALTLTDKLFTAHSVANRAATLVCKKLGFKEDFILMRKDR